ncbi:MAG: hypothetical protein O3C60_13870 [Planctomycetota bacterium]|nr:hypothetical protein [Planctomycetota bacterium]
MLVVKDEQGQLVPWSDISYGELNRLISFRDGIERPAPPRGIVSRIDVAGKVSGSNAELLVTLEVQLNSSEWVKLPLPLPPGSLRDQPNHEGDGKFLLDRDIATGDYVAWIQGTPGQKHQIVLPLDAHADNQGEMRRIDFEFPSASQTALKIVLPAKQLHVATSPSAGVLTTSSTDEATQLELHGFKERFWIEWSVSAAETKEVESALLVSEAQIQVDIEAPGRVLCTADFSISCPPMESLSTIEIRLPPHARFVEGTVADAAGAEFHEMPAAQDNSEIGASFVVQVQLPNPTTKSVKIKLHTRTERDENADVADGGIEVANFHVSQSLRQTGIVELNWRHPWEVRWKPSDSIRRSWGNIAGTDSLTSRDSKVLFEFTQQPCELRVQAMKRPSLLRVEPSYTLRIQPESLELEARLIYHRTGTPSDELTIRMGEWKVESLEPRQSTNEQPHRSWTLKDGILKVPAWSFATATQPEFELRIRAYRPLKLDAEGRVEFDLPRPDAESLLGATCEILTHERVDLTLDRDLAASLVPDASTSAHKSDPGFRREGRYRLPSAGSPRKIAGNVRVLQKIVTAQVKSKALLDAETIGVSQTFAYRVQNEATRRLEWIVPRELLNVRMTIHVDGEPLVTTPWRGKTDLPTVPGDRNLLLIGIYLPKLQAGRFSVDLDFQLPLTSSGPQRIPLVMPVVDSFDGNTCSLQCDSRWRIRDTPIAPWTRTTGLKTDLPTAFPILQMSSPSEANHLKIDLELVPAEERLQVRVAKFWLQSWFSQTERRDRAVFNFTTQSPTISLNVPPNARDFHLILDGIAVAANRPSTAPNTYSIPVQRQAKDLDSHVLEVAYHLPHAGWWRPQSIELARLDHASVDVSHLSVVLPSNEFMVSGTSLLTTEQQWRWNGFYWTAESTATQEVMERQISASRQSPPAATSQEFTFSTIGEIDPVAIRFAPRLAIAALVSGMVFLVGIGLIYVPTLRHPTTLLVAVCFLIPLIVTAPQYALFLAQFAGPGILFATLALALYRMTTDDSNRAWPSSTTLPMSGSPSSRHASPIASTATSQPLSAGSSVPSVVR